MYIDTSALLVSNTAFTYSFLRLRTDELKIRTAEL